MKAPRLSLLALAIASGLLQAQGIRVDGSTGVPPQTLNGPDYQITQSLGRLAGSNLFHSFDFFSLNPQESARFTLQSPGIAHVISRVTGGMPSLLAGTIRLQAVDGNPALYFINPAGVLLGAGVQLDVPGGFHLSTAAQLRMADGSRWESSGGNSFSAAAPEAFGFLGGAAAPVYLLPGTVLSGAPGQTLQLVAADLQLDDARLVSSGGLRLAAVGDQAVDLPLQGVLPATLNGDISLRNGALAGVVVAGAAAGRPLELAAGSLQLESGSGLVSQTLQGSSGTAPALHLQLSGNLTMTGDSYVESVSTTGAAGGPVQLQAAAAFLSEKAYFWSRNLGEGPGGALQFQLGAGLLMSSGANLYSSSQGGGAGGAIEVQAPLIFLDPGAFITSVGFDGGAGAILLQAGELLSLDGAGVKSDLQGSGAGGSITLRSGGALSLLGQSRVASSSSGPVRAGAITLEAQTLNLADGSLVSSASVDQGAGPGALSLIATGALNLDSGASLRLLSVDGGDPALLSLQGGSISLGSGVYLANSGVGLGQRSGPIVLAASGSISLQGAELVTLGVDGADAGSISLQGQELWLGGLTQLASNAGDSGGAAGSISLAASGSVRLSGQTLVTSSTGSALDAGRISVQAGSIRMEDEATISTFSIGGSGRGGDIELRASADLLLGGSSLLLSSADGAGSGGNVLLQAQSIRLQDHFRSFSNTNGVGGGQGGNLSISALDSIHIGGTVGLDASTFSSSGDAGRIQLLSGGALTMQGGTISSFSAGGSGRGGDVLLQAGGALQLGPGSSIGTSAVAAGDAGSVRLLAPQIALSGAEIRSNTGGPSGNAGLVEIRADSSLSLSDATRVSSSTFGGGAAGNLSLQGRDILLSSGSSVLAFADQGSSGQTGQIDLLAQQLIRLQGGSTISNANGATVADPASLQSSLLRLRAPRIELDNTLLSAAALGNTDASRIELLAGERLLLSDSVVSTAAQDGDGGALRAEAGQLLWLKRSALTTSVLGVSGDGGDIDIKTDLLFLQGGFIQANTAAADASGGDVRIETGALVASENRVVIGGDAPLVFDPQRPLNVIQAAAPNGVSGAVAVSNTLDIAGSLALLDRSLLDPGGLGRSPCERRGGSALAAAGRGGLPAPPLAPLGAPPQRAAPPPVGWAQLGLWGDCR